MRRTTISHFTFLILIQVRLSIVIKGRSAQRLTLPLYNSKLPFSTFTSPKSFFTSGAEFSRPSVK